MWLLLAFVAVPMVEIALFIQVGGWLGTWPTLAIVLGTAMLGTILVRSQGSRAMADLRGSFQRLQDPLTPLAHGAMILVSAALLLTPGFFTDAVGFALLIPMVRVWVLQAILKRVHVQRFEMGPESGASSPGRPDIIDGDFEEITNPGPKPGEQGASDWTRH